MTSPSEGPVEGRQRAILWCLWSVRGVRHGHLAELRRRVDLPQWWKADEAAAREELAAIPLGSSALESVMELRGEVEDPETAHRYERGRIPEPGSLLHVDDADYPRRLYDLEEPPEFLYVRGRVEALRRPRTVAAVGSRRIDVEDARRASGIVQQLAEQDVSVVSGGALGADAVLHEGCLEGGAPTVVVLPSALDEPTPKRNLDLFGRAVERGAVISEYPLGVDLRNYHFPRRNRLIAALGDVTFIVRCDCDSGTMLTAEATDDLGRPMCALFGGLDEPLAQGCLDLIVDGAQGVRGAEDILETYFPERLVDSGDSSDGDAVASGSSDRGSEGDTQGGSRRLPDPGELDGLSDQAEEVLRAARKTDGAGSNGLHVDVIDEETTLDAQAIQSALLELELRGICEKLPGTQAYTFGTASPGRRT